MNSEFKQIADRLKYELCYKFIAEILMYKLIAASFSKDCLTIYIGSEDERMAISPTM